MGGAGIAAGCSSSTVVPSSGSETAVTLGAATIGPEGGSVALGRVRLDFPPGALAVATDVSIRVLEVSSPEYPKGIDASTEVFTFAPNGLTFAEPVLATFEAADLPHDSAIVWSDPSSPDGFSLLDTTAAHGSFSALVTHFSDGWVVTQKVLNYLCAGKGKSTQRCCLGRCGAGAICGSDHFCQTVLCKNPKTDCYPSLGKPVVDPCQFATDCALEGSQEVTTPSYICNEDHRCLESAEESKQTCSRTPSELPSTCCTAGGHQCDGFCCDSMPPAFCSPIGQTLVTSDLPFVACGAGTSCLFTQTEKDCANEPPKPQTCKNTIQEARYTPTCTAAGGPARCDFIETLRTCPPGESCVGTACTCAAEPSPHMTPQIPLNAA